MPDGHLKILIVEDNAVDRAIWRRHLSRPVDEFECWEVETGEAGLERCLEFRPDCIFLDFNLPDLTGTEFLRRLQGVYRCAVIVATAYGSEDVAVRSLKTGATDYLVKSGITAEVLRRAIHSAVEKVRLQIEVEQRGVELEQRNGELEAKHRDLTAALEGERQARVAAEDSESRYRNLTEAIPHVVWTASTPCAFDHVNSRWGKLTGIAADLAIGERWLALVHKDDLPRIAEKWEESARTMRGFEAQFRLRTAGDSWRWQSIRGVPFIEQGTPPVKWYGTLTDIEDRARAEQLLNQKQKLESIGVLAAGIAHDFNNLLVGVIGNVSLASDILPDCDTARPLLAEAVQSAERVAALTRRLLAYAGKSNFALRRVNLSELVDSTSRLVIPGISKNIRVSVTPDKDRLEIEADPSQLQQVVMNLVINAAEAIGESNPGTICLRTSSVQIGAENGEGLAGHSGSELATGRYAALEVTDNGCGMDDETKAKVFDPFFTTKFLGRGLGLASVQGIVHGHKGAIEVQSRPGAGATFRVLIPVCEAATAKTSELSRENAEGVLVVDGDPGVRVFIDQALQRAGIGRVWTATSGEEALAIAAEHRDQISAVLLDLGLSGISGEETLSRLRGEGLACPVIVSSANGEVDALRRLGSQAIDCLLIKPYTARDLVKAVVRNHAGFIVRGVPAERGSA